ncbi:MAG: hypothetical protein ACTSWR_09795 [Candidatus Helarchaeota archaeon]
MSLEVHIDDLLDWFNDAVRKKVEPTKRIAEKKISKFKDIISEFKDACNNLYKVEPSAMDQEDLSAKSAQRLSLKYKKELESINIPEEPYTYESMETFKKNLGRLINNFLQWGRKLIPKLSYIYKKEIQGINFYFQSLGNEWKKFSRFIENKYKDIREIDRTISKIQKLQDIFQQIQEQRRNQKEIEFKIEELQNQIKEIEEDLEKINKNSNLKKLSALEIEYSKLKQKLMGQIGALRKAFLKFEKILGDKYRLTPEPGKKLIEYYESPYNTFIKEKEGYPILKEILSELKKALENKDLDLSASKNQKAISKVKSILNNSLLPLQKELIDIETKIKEINDDQSIKDLIKEKQALKNKSNQIKLQIEEEQVNLNKIIDNYERNKDKIIEQRSELIKKIKEITKKEINIKFE